MKMRCFAIILLLTVAASSPAAAQLSVTITVDNAYGFGFGPTAGMTTYYGGMRNLAAGDIYVNPPGAGVLNPSPPYTVLGVGAEQYVVPSPAPTDYVYIVAWSDDAVYQGALAGFQLQGGPLLSGTGWRVFATGIDRDSGIESDTLTVADLGLINSQIALANANAGGAGSSVGWVDQSGMLPNAAPGVGALAIGPQNVNGAFHGYNAIQGISNQSQWMWYNKDPGFFSDPFTYSGEGSGGHSEFLIFRQQIGTVPEPSTLLLAASAGLGLLVFAARKRKEAAASRAK
ncbi:MAG: PEP-CTERM sorting domain-containing protein [Pirellulales bacterium]|nr:PEP-CTERM sorting domain-containing protein [Pirellulales bacterium]